MDWDKLYSADDYVYGVIANDFLRQKASDLKSGNVLCLAEGEGRNAVYLAKLGFTVTAVDASIVGLKKAEKLAKQHAVNLQLIHANLAEYVIAENSWDNIVSIWCHLPRPLRVQVHQAVVSGLKPQGRFVLEAYTPKQLQYKTGGPASADFMMQLSDLNYELTGLDIVHAEELIRDVAEGSKHLGKSAVVQLFGLKPE